MNKRTSFFTDYSILMITFQSEFGIKKIRVFHLFVYLLVIILSITFLSVGYVYYKYYQTKKLYTNYHELKKDFLQQNVNNKINQENLLLFSDKLKSFQAFDTKVRRIASAKNYSKVNNKTLSENNFQEQPLYADLELEERNLKNQISNIQLSGQIRKNSFLELEVIIRDNLEKLTRTPSIKPLEGGKFTSGFGVRKDPFDGSLQFHNGIDWAGSLYTPIFAPADGRVVYAYYGDSYGNLIAINHGYKIITRYAHMSKFEKKVGDFIKRGEIIGRMGNSGKRTTGTHLHYEIIINGKHTDPLSYIIDDDTINLLAENTNVK